MAIRTLSKRRKNAPATLEALEVRTLLTTFTVTTLADTIAEDGETSLREAIAQAGENDSTDEIVFADGLNGVLNLQLGELQITSPVTIAGNGRDNTIIDAQSNSDIFFQGDRLTLRSLTLRNSAGDGLRSGGGLTIEDAVITGSGGRGVAMSHSHEYYFGRLRITNSVITGNTGRGVEIEGSVSATIVDSVISENAGGLLVQYGGGGAASPSAIIQRSAIRQNVAVGGGGGILVDGGDLTVEDSIISGNEASTGAGIDFEYGYRVQISRSTISDNTASSTGGGLRIKGPSGRRQLDNLTISGNTAAQGGGFYFGFPGFSGNIIDLVNSTIVDNTATDQGGGVFFAVDPTTTIDSNIIAQNTAPNGGADLWAGSTTDATFRNNFVGTNGGSDLANTGTTPDSNGNFIGTSGALLDPLLGSETTVGLHRIRRPLPDSLTINNGGNSFDLENDQLGLARSINGGVDIGAVEAVSGAIDVGSDASVTEGNSGTNELIFEVTLTEDTGPFTVDVTTLDGTANAGEDYQAHSETLSFQGTVGETKQIIVLVNGDQDFELSETVLLGFENISDSSIELPETATGLIINDETSDSIRLQGRRLIVTGTPNADTISLELNGQFIDVVLNDETGSFANADVTSIEITGNNGADAITITDVSHETTILGGDGDDTIQGGPGKDRIFGGDGNDSLFGGPTRDIIRGEAGDDLILGEGGDDVIRGGDGDDTLRGGDDNDLIYGEVGLDEIEGQDGNDRLRGGGGNDTLRGAAGRDSLGGGGGGDLLNGGDDADILAGSNGADRLNGGNGDDHMNGGQGQDTIVGGDGDDTLLGRQGNDVLLGDAGNDLLNGLTEQDILYGGEGEDTLQGRASEDILIAGFITPPSGSTVRDMLIGGIRDEWLSDRSYAERVANITDGDGQTSNRLNTEFLIGRGFNDQNVFNDSDRDEVIGGSGSLDLFFARAGSDLLDKANSEFLQDI